jgi:hypothetical protein
MERPLLFAWPHLPCAMGNPTPQQMRDKMEEQFHFIRSECGLTYPEDVAWIEESGHWYKQLEGIKGHLGRLDIRVENGWYLPEIHDVASNSAGYETLAEAQAACDEVARYRLPGMLSWH